MIDGERVREIAFAFRKRTSCAEDQVATEMLRELDSDIWETIASCFQFRLMNRWTEDTDKLWKTQLVTMVKKNNGKLTMRVFRPIAMLPTIYRLYSKTLEHWRKGLCNQDVVHSTVTSLAGRLTKWCGCSDGWWNRLRSGKFWSS